MDLLTGSLSRLFYDEKKIHLVYPEEMDSNVRDYSYDLAFQVIQEAFQLIRVLSHLNAKMVNPIFHSLSPS